MFSVVVITALAGAVAGCLGALLGIGGGVFMVPFLNLVLDLPIKMASGISLISVIATSSVTSASKGRLQLVNLRLGLLLEIFTTAGGVAGVFFVNRLSESTLRWLFGWACAVIAAVMLTRVDRRNVIRESVIDVGVLGGRYFEAESRSDVAYRVRRLPLAFSGSFFAGLVSVLGIGGGVLKVPVLNAWCGVPMRAAAATSALMLGATAVVGSINAFAHGYISRPELAAATVLGVLGGSRLGIQLAERSRAKSQKMLMAGVLLTVAVVYFTVAAG